MSLDLSRTPERIGEFLHAQRWLLPPGRKTHVWSIYTIAGLWLGDVKWFAAWRCFNFFPRHEQQTSYDAKCLRALAQFCDDKKKEHQATR